MTLIKSSEKIIYNFKRSCFSASSKQIDESVFSKVFRKFEDDFLSMIFERNDRLETGL